MDVQTTRSKVQMLYDACNKIHGQEELPTFQQIQLLKDLMDTIEAVDVGIDEFSLPGFLPSSPQGVKGLICGRGVPEITYIHIHECDDFSIGVFCFPAGGMFPLHDHPGMTVLSKLLYGSVYVKAYDWVRVDNSGCRTGRGEGIEAIGNVGQKGLCVGLAGAVTDGILSAPCETSILFPRSGGNIHSFTALTPCAILDVLSPPYSEELGRPSNYYSELFIPSLPRGYMVLEEKDLPDDLVVVGAPYLGPSLVTKDDPF